MISAAVNGMARTQRAGATASVSSATPAHTDDAHAEGAGQGREPQADAAKADHDQRLAAKLVLAAGPVADHRPPETLGLIVAREMELACQRQDQRHRVFGDGALIAALATGEADAAGGKALLVELVGAGADRLDETQLAGEIDDLRRHAGAVHGPDQVGHEHKAALEHGDDQEVGRRIGGDLRCHLGIAGGDGGFVVEDPDTLGLGHRLAFLPGAGAR